MRTRHILVLLAIAVVLAAGVIGCNPFGSVSITERISQFQTDLNSADRSNIYMNFHPTSTSDYNALKSSSATLDSVIDPVGSGPNYTLTITDQSDPSTGVLVTISAGPAAWSTYPRYLKLVMETTGVGDYRIVSLWLDDGSGNFTGSPQIP
jgi:hypothetical protein